MKLVGEVEPAAALEFEILLLVVVPVLSEREAREDVEDFVGVLLLSC